MTVDPIRALTFASALFATAAVGCNSAPPDCSDIVQRYRTLCPDDTSGAATTLGERCVSLQMATTCTREAAALRACWAADFDGFGGALCGSDLFTTACATEEAAFTACDRDPPVPPAPRCIGYSIDCGDLDPSFCDSQLGCTSTSLGCDGLEESCSAFTSSGSCNAQWGCAWDVPGTEPGSCIGYAIDCSDLDFATCDGQLGCISTSLGCDGLEESCSAFRAPGTCGAQLGCAWEPPSDGSGSCIGNAIDCSDLDFATCDGQLGCISTSLGCDGLEEGCSAFQTAGSCGAQLGCQWEPG